MDDIDRAKIGQRREVAYETDKHSKIPQTNLPPMRAKGVDEKFNKLLHRNRGIPWQKKKSWSVWIVVFLIVLLILVTKFLGYW